MGKHKPTRTEDNLPSRSTPIRKGSMSKEQIEATAKELTKVPEIIQEVQAPKCEPIKNEVKEKGDYKAFALSIKSKFQTNNDTVELTGDFMKSLFPQVKCAGDVARNLNRSYGLSYRRVENGRNDTYVFFIEPTREELMIEGYIFEKENIKLKKENGQLKSDLSNQHTDKLILLGVAILSVISIILK